MITSLLNLARAGILNYQISPIGVSEILNGSNVRLKADLNWASKECFLAKFLYVHEMVLTY